MKPILLTNMNMDVTMVDEVTDNRTIKHLAICTRFINQKGVSCICNIYTKLQVSDHVSL
jgi:stage V sporulation protein SpoVS